jgi:PAS domain S-box-containing protein
MKKLLRVLIIEDSADDTLLILHQVKKGGFTIEYDCVDSAEKMKYALKKNWDIVLSDYHMPNFNGLEAFRLLQETCSDIPFILISGTIGEDIAVEAMRSGVNDYIMKSNMFRLVPAIEREIREAGNRAERRLLEQKQKQVEIIKESESKLKNLVQDMPVGVILRNPQAEVIMSNSHARELLELSEEQLLGKTPFTSGWNAIHEDGTPLPTYIFPAYQAIADHRPIRGVVMGVYRPTKGDRVWILVDAIPQFNDDGTIKQVVSTFIDITKLKATEKALQESESLYRSILYASPDDVTITDLEGRILSVSHSGIKMFGYDNEEELLGHSVSEYLINEDIGRAMNNISLMFQGIRTGPAEYHALRKDGTIFDIEANAEFILDSEATPIKIVLIIRNITQRKQAEEKLIKLNTAVEQSPVSIIVTNRDGVIEYINPYFANNTGYNYDEIIGQNPRILKSDKTPDETYKQLWATITSGNIWKGELCNKKKNGDLYWERVSISPVVNNSGYITHYIGVKENITTEKNALEALRESEERYRKLVEMSPDAVAIHQQGKIVYINSSGIKLFDANTPGELIGKPIIDLIHPDYRNIAIKRIEKTLSGGNVPYIEEKFVRLDGTIFDVEVTAIPSVFQGLPATQVVVRDITERKLTQEALRESQQFLSDIIENNGALIYAKDRDGHYELVNKRWEEVTGMKREFTIGKTDEELFPGTDGTEFRKKDMEVIESGNILEFEEAIEDASGKRFFISIKFPLRDKNYAIKGICGMSTEITERIRINEEIKLKNEELEKVNAEKDKFFSILAHDLRSPFIVFVGLTELMAKKTTGMSVEKVQEYALSIRNSAIKIFNLLENLLEWSRIQRGLVPFELKSLTINQLTEDSLASLWDLAQTKGIEIATNIPDEMKVLADGYMIQSVIRNLVSNALKFTPRGGKIYVSANFNSDKIVEVSVKDNGIGMNHTIIENLFKLDVQTNRPGTEDEPSSGLGLLLCKEFIEKHKGKIWVESEEGKGTTFFFTIPC